MSTIRSGNNKSNLIKCGDIFIAQSICLFSSYPVFYHFTTPENKEPYFLPIFRSYKKQFCALHCPKFMGSILYICVRVCEGERGSERVEFYEKILNCVTTCY